MPTSLVIDTANGANFNGRDLINVDRLAVGAPVGTSRLRVNGSTRVNGDTVLTTGSASFDGGALPVGTVIGDRLLLPVDATIPLVAANNNDINIGDASTVLFTLSGGGNFTITGFTGGESGRILYAIFQGDTGSTFLTISDEDGGSSSLNRIDLGTGVPSPTLTVSDSVFALRFVYNSLPVTSGARWTLMEPGVAL